MNQLPVSQFVSFFSNPQNATSAVLGTMKLLIILILSLYLVFGVIILRQISLMTKTVDTPLTPKIKFLGYIHMIFAVLVWLCAIVLL